MTPTIVVYCNINEYNYTTSQASEWTMTSFLCVMCYYSESTNEVQIMLLQRNRSSAILGIDTPHDHLIHDSDHDILEEHTIRNSCLGSLLI
jgi:hypothetical protein